MSRSNEQKLKIALAEATRELGQQEATLDELRLRSGTIMGLFVVATSFFGSGVIATHHIRPIQVIALVAFLVVLILQASVLTVKGEWFFTTKIENNLIDALNDDSIESYLSALIKEFDDMTKCNVDKLEKLQLRFNLSVYLLIVDMAIWALAAIWH